VYDFDILGLYITTTRKALHAALSGEQFLAVEHAKRDRLLVYVLAHLFGHSLVPLKRVEDMAPATVMAAAVTYTQFVEVRRAPLARALYALPRVVAASLAVIRKCSVRPVEGVLGNTG
jgi:hypothetical protein